MFRQSYPPTSRQPRPLYPGLILLVLVAGSVLFYQRCGLPADRAAENSRDSAAPPAATPGTPEADSAQTTPESAPTTASAGSPGENAAEAAAGQPFGRSRWENPAWNGGVVAGAQLPRAVPVVTEGAPPALGWTGQRPTGARSKGTARSIAVLCYHQTFAGEKTFAGFNVPPDQFEAQLVHLKKEGYQSVSHAQVLRAVRGDWSGLPEKPVLLTFDDGLESNYTVVYPLLKKHGFRATLFLYPTILGANRKNYMNWRQVTELAQSGVFEIGSHTLYHPMLPMMSDKELERQLRESKRILEERLHVRIQLLAYPFGLYDTRVIAAARRAGYALGFTINTGGIRPGDDAFTLNRYMVVTAHDVKTFAAYLKTRAPAVDNLEPADGSHVRAGDVIRVRVRDVQADSVRISLNGRALRLSARGDTYSASLPAVRAARGILPLEIRARDADGRNLSRRYLYLDQSRFEKKAKTSQPEPKRRASHLR